jgi:serine/threonine-protein kinase RsbT
MQTEIGKRVPIDTENDIVSVRKEVRQTASLLGFGLTDITRIVTAASELARNVFHYAGSGYMQLKILTVNGSTGIELLFADKGPGIPDVERALEMGFSTRAGLGLGLPGAKRLMSEMEIHTKVSEGTTVKVRKWLK